MGKGLLIGLAMTLVSSVANAAATCPNLNGKWVGSCRVENASAPSYMSNIHPLLQQTASELQISQGENGNAVKCRLLSIGGTAVAVGGVRTEALSFATDDGSPINVSSAIGSYWQANGLSSKISGLVQSGENSFMAFQGSNTMTLLADGRLESLSEISGENFASTVRCSYRKL